MGIETGPAIVGDVGGSRKLDYTAHRQCDECPPGAGLEAAKQGPWLQYLRRAWHRGHGLIPTTLRQIGTLTLRGQSGEIKV